MWMVRDSRLAALLSCLGLLAAPVGLAAAQAAPVAELEVVPGGVVRWPGVDLVRCGIDDRSWMPLANACWYPVDLLRTAGGFEVWRVDVDGRRSRSLQVAAYPYPEQRITLEDDSKVNLSAADSARAQRESVRIAALWPRESPRRFDLPLAPPLAELPAGGRFGARRIFNDQPRSPHTGVDFSAPEGTAVLAVAAGEVRLAEGHFFAGNSVFIDHGDGLVSMYFHLSGIDVEPGDEVERGQPIGRVGQSGRASGPHLHFGVRWHGARVDPIWLLAPEEQLPRLR